MIPTALSCPKICSRFWASIELLFMKKRCWFELEIAARLAINRDTVYKPVDRDATLDSDAWAKVGQDGINDRRRF
jgi:hypothetical protein